MPIQDPSSPPGLHPPLARYRSFPDTPRFGLGSDRELVYAPLSRRAVALPATTARLLPGCHAMRTLEEHAHRLSRDGAGIEALRQQLQHLASAGLLVGEAELMRRCGRHAEGSNKLTIDMIGIPTRGRPELLERCLSSYVDNDQRTGRQRKYVIIDSSPDATAPGATSAIVAAQRQRTGAALVAIHPKELAQYAEALASKAGVRPELVRFALLGGEDYAVTTGASRNALLLQAAGELMLQVDDDTICALGPAPGAQGGLAISSLYDPTEFWFASSGQELPMQLVPGDVPGVHEQMLGKAIAELMPADGPMDFDQASAGFFRKLERSNGGVATTATGVAGDSGMGSSVAFMSLGNPSRERLLRDPAVYRDVLIHHRVVRGVTRATVSDGAYCMALCLGLDVRGLLPPFLPVQRNQDGVFGAVLRTCFPGRWLGLLPVAVAHDPPPRPRTAAGPILDGLMRLTTGQIIQSLVSSFDARTGQRSERHNLEHLGMALGEWGTAPAADFEELVRLRCWSGISAQANRLTALLRQSNSLPVFWSKDAAELIEKATQTLPGAGWPVPVDLAGAGEAVAWQRLQALVGQFGELLRCWPHLMETAREMKRTGAGAQVLEHSK